MYIVSGATGQTGSVVARTLLEKGLPVRVIVRSEEKGKPWKDLRAEVAIADVRDADALTKAFEGGKVLYLMNPPNEQSEDMFVETEKIIKAFQTAIENSSPEKLVALSSVGAHLPSGTGPIITNRMLEQAFGDSDIPTTFVIFRHDFGESMAQAMNVKMPDSGFNCINFHPTDKTVRS